MLEQAIEMEEDIVIREYTNGMEIWQCTNPITNQFVYEIYQNGKLVRSCQRMTEAEGFIDGVLHEGIHRGESVREILSEDEGKKEWQEMELELSRERKKANHLEKMAKELVQGLVRDRGANLDINALASELNMEIEEKEEEVSGEIREY